MNQHIEINYATHQSDFAFDKMDDANPYVYFLKTMHDATTSANYSSIGGWQHLHINSSF